MINWEIRRKISKGLKNAYRIGRRKSSPLSKETKEKISRANKGRRHTKEALKKIGEASKELIRTPEHCAKISKANMGKHLSDVTKQKLSKFNKGKKLTVETRRKMGQSRSGSNNCNWKGGLTLQKDQIRASFGYKLWRKSVFERDKFTCAKSKVIGGYLIAHHINNFSESPELRFSIKNGITLSRKAHLEFHKRFGFKNNTKEQLDLFLGGQL